MTARYRFTTAAWLGAISVTATLAIALAGCSDGRADDTVTGRYPSKTPAAAPTPTGPAPTVPTEAGASEPPASATTPIVIEFVGGQITGELDNSAASASLIAQLPLTLSFGDHAGQEKLARLPTPLDLSGAPDASDAPPLTIGYYAPDQVLVLYYEQVGSFAGIVPLGSFENADALTGQTGDFTATVRQAN